MREIQNILELSDKIRQKRAGLAAELKELEQRHSAESCRLNNEHISKIDSIRQQRDKDCADITREAKISISTYSKMKNSLKGYEKEVLKWCPKNRLTQFVPKPSRVNETELKQLVSMLEESGIIAWIKRTLQLNGYASRETMALDMWKKIVDCSAYCDEKIAETEKQTGVEQNKCRTQARRDEEQENSRYLAVCDKLQAEQAMEKHKLMRQMDSCATTERMQALRETVRGLQQEAKNSCGLWGEYSVPEAMPEKVVLCDVGVDIPREGCGDERVKIPLWIDLFRSNIIVITSDSSAGTDKDEGRLLVRRLLARMLKTIPPDNCSYSIFDQLYQGASLGRLVDVTNIGVTDIRFDLFTSNEGGQGKVSCTDRRRFLRESHAEIIKFTAGRSSSLYEYVKEKGCFDFPFSWYIEFDFPDDPNDRLREDIISMFTTASAAGYSFVFVTGSKGLEKIKELASRGRDTNLLHIDLDKRLCRVEGMPELRYMESDAPNPDSNQIYNFMTALKKFYDEGVRCDNRIAAVFEKYGIQIMDATKKLTVPIALDSRGKLVNMELGGGNGIHGFISGDTGSGKSTLLRTVILSACLHYTPEDLEIWLADFKTLEFSIYKNHTPPHIKLIGVSPTAEFAFSLLEKISAEAKRRTELMTSFNALNLEEYRAHKGEPGYEHFPRLLVVIDEFHRMSQFVSDSENHKNMLENVAREYRSQAINLLLADQTFSTGLSGLTTAAKAQIGLRIAMRNAVAPQELKDTLEVDRAMYTESIENTINTMGRGDLIMKTYVINANGIVTNVKLERFKALFADGQRDTLPISRALRKTYKGRFADNRLYVNTMERVPWNDEEPLALDKLEPIRYPNIRLYLGRSATLRPCFGLDIGRQPNENLSIVGGTVLQRWQMLASIMESCRLKGYKMLVFAAEYADIMNDHGREVKELCMAVPGAEYAETMEQWCEKLKRLKGLMDDRVREDIVCIFIGLEIAADEMERLPRAGNAPGTMSMSNPMISAFQAASRFGTPVGESPVPPQVAQPEEPKAFDARELISELFSNGARNGLRCVAEVSVVRKFNRLLKLADMCRHKVAFSMGSDDCLSYLGNSKFESRIGEDGVYCDGGINVEKIIAYVKE